MEIIKLNNSIWGWILVPVSENSYGILDILYNGDYRGMTPTDRFFMKGKAIEAAIAHIKEVCSPLGIKISLCGKKDSPTIRCWQKTVSEMDAEVIEVDLKWSLWSKDRSTWERYSPGTFDRIQQAFLGEGKPVMIQTSPKKEIRYGSVTISKGYATGHFTCEWDEAPDIADTLGVEDDNSFRVLLPFSEYSLEPGVDRAFQVKARLFTKLMERIDLEEDRVCKRSDCAWAELEQLLVQQ